MKTKLTPQQKRAIAKKHKNPQRAEPMISSRRRNITDCIDNLGVIMQAANVVRSDSQEQRIEHCIHYLKQARAALNGRGINHPPQPKLMPVLPADSNELAELLINRCAHLGFSSVLAAIDRASLSLTESAQQKLASATARFPSSPFIPDPSGVRRGPPKMPPRTRLCPFCNAAIHSNGITCVNCGQNLE